LWDENGQLFIMNNDFEWLNRTDINDGAAGNLPEAFTPVAGYWHNVGGSEYGEINLFDANGEFWIYNITNGEWNNRTNVKEDLGILTNKVPVNGYFDEISEMVILIYDDSMYGLKDGTGEKFELLRTFGSEPCINDSDCDEGYFCNDDGERDNLRRLYK